LREKSVHHTPATDDDAQTGEIRYKTPLKMNCREFVFKKLAGLPENLKIAYCSALP